MGIMLLAGMAEQREHLICILGCDVAFLPSFTSIHFSYRCHFFLFSVFFSSLKPTTFFLPCLLCAKVCEKRVHSLIETREKNENSHNIAMMLECLVIQRLILTIKHGLLFSDTVQSAYTHIKHSQSRSHEM